MQLFYEFTNNTERDNAIGDAQFEMAQAKYERDMAVIEANYKYNQKLAEYKCLVENGTYDDYAHMIFLATEEAEDQEAEAKKGLFDSIKDFFMRIIDAFKYIFTGKMKVEKVPEPDPEELKKANSILDSVQKTWRTFVGKITGNNQPLDDDPLNQILQSIAAITGLGVLKVGTDVAADKVKSAIKPVSDKVSSVYNEINSWIYGYIDNIEDKKKNKEDVGNMEKVLSQALKVAKALMHPIESIKDLATTVKNWFEGKFKKKDENSEGEGEENKDNNSSENNEGDKSSDSKDNDNENKSNNSDSNSSGSSDSQSSEKDAKFNEYKKKLEEYKTMNDNVTKDTKAERNKLFDELTTMRKELTRDLHMTDVPTIPGKINPKNNSKTKNNNPSPTQPADQNKNNTPKQDDSSKTNSNNNASTQATDASKKDDSQAKGTTDNKPNEGNASAWDDDFDVDAMFAEFGL